jgi:hypothetical protein
MKLFPLWIFKRFSFVSPANLLRKIQHAEPIFEFQDEEFIFSPEGTDSVAEWIKRGEGKI